MPRLPRLVAPGHPHRVTQRGSRRQATFFCDDDYSTYRDLLAHQLPKAETDLLAYCLMPNHVHLIVIPNRRDSLSRLLRITHGCYAHRINLEHGWQGHLWQERFRSFVMDEDHLLAAARYVELNPVRAGLCSRPEEWPWSSVHFHLQNIPDPLISGCGMRAFVDDWHSLLAEGLTNLELDILRNHSRNGRPAGCLGFVRTLESTPGQRMTVRRRRSPGP